MSNKRRIKAQDLPLCSPLVELASEDDRVWFASHPGVDVRIRPLMEGEFGIGVTPRGKIVTVIQVRPGVRIRRIAE